jgi:hypothetical protein
MENRGIAGAWKQVNAANIAIVEYEIAARLNMLKDTYEIIFTKGNIHA